MDEGIIASPALHVWVRGRLAARAKLGSDWHTLRCTNSPKAVFDNALRSHGREESICRFTHRRRSVSTGLAAHVAPMIPPIRSTGTGMRLAGATHISKAATQLNLAIAK